MNKINRRYDMGMFDPFVEEWYEHSDFHNLGYWLEDTRSQREACENLMEKLLAFIPKKEGNILDVACGKGATTKYLLKYYLPSAVTGMNISKRQLKRGKENAPSCSFLLMDATKLGFEDNSFEAIICVEAAFHFKSRERFLREARRVLKPSGRLVLSDILMTHEAEGRMQLYPSANYVDGLKEYQAVWDRAGFETVGLIDATDECLRRYCQRRSRYVQDKFRLGQIDGQTLMKVNTVLKAFSRSTRCYLLVSGRTL